MGLTVSRPVLIKAVVTESFKRLYIQDLEEAMKRVDAIVLQIDTQIRRAELERQVSPQSRAVRQQLELESARQEANKAEASMRLRGGQGGGAAGRTACGARCASSLRPIFRNAWGCWARRCWSPTSGPNPCGSRP